MFASRRRAQPRSRPRRPAAAPRRRRRCSRPPASTVIAAAHSLQLALLGALIVGVGFSMLFPSLALMVVGDVDDERRGSALGAFTAFFDIGVGLGGPIAGATAALAGYSAVFYLSAAAALGTRGAGGDLRRARPPRSPTSRSGG